MNVVKFVRREKKQLSLHHPNTAALLSTSATTNGSLPHKDEKGNDQPASMMEQLVPEIMQHTLSYLDYRSLCNMSMTCSVLRRVANDDSVWKAVFHKVSSQSSAMGRHKLALLCLNFSPLLIVPVSDSLLPYKLNLKEKYLNPSQSQLNIKSLSTAQVLIDILLPAL